MRISPITRLIIAFNWGGLRRIHRAPKYRQFDSLSAIKRSFFFKFICVWPSGSFSFSVWSTLLSACSRTHSPQSTIPDILRVDDEQGEIRRHICLTCVWFNVFGMTIAASGQWNWLSMRKNAGVLYKRINCTAHANTHRVRMRKKKIPKHRKKRRKKYEASASEREETKTKNALYIKRTPMAAISYLLGQVNCTP